VFDAGWRTQLSTIRESPCRSAGTPAKAVQIAGWLYTCAAPGRSRFRFFGDGYGLMQCVAVKAALPEELFETVKNLTQESSIIVTGKIRAEQRAPGGFEMDLENLEWCSAFRKADRSRITPKEHGTDVFLWTIATCGLRSSSASTPSSAVRHEVIKAVRDYFDSHGFTLVDTPIFTPAACEEPPRCSRWITSRTNKAFLTQSGQLYNEATAMAFGKGLLLWTDFPRRKIQDAAPPHRVSGWWSRRWPTPRSRCQARWRRS